METVSSSAKRKNYVGYLLLFFIILALPLVIYVVKQNTDVRPRALTGQADLILSADTTTADINGQIVVLVSAQLSDTALRMSGADVTVLYDKNMLEVVSAQPNTTAQTSGAPFTDAPIINTALTVDTQFQGVRIAQISNKSSAELPSGTVSLGKIIFRAKSQGNAVIKFPTDTSTMEIVGVRL